MILMALHEYTQKPRAVLLILAVLWYFFRLSDVILYFYCHGLRSEAHINFHLSPLKSESALQQSTDILTFTFFRTKIEGDIELLRVPERILPSVPKNIIYLQGCIKYGINSSTHTDFTASQLQSKLFPFNKLKVKLGKIHAEGFDFGRKGFHLHRVPPQSMSSWNLLEREI